MAESEATTLSIRLSGTSAAVTSGLDRLLVCATVLGVVEHASDLVEVALAADLAAVRAWLDGRPGLDWCAMPAAAGPPPTGLENDRAIRVSERLLVRPPWVPVPSGFEGLELVVPRGMAFGSGEHGSTQAALVALDAVWPELPGAFADIGTGSGVLALYAHSRGASRILACDVEVAAVRAARELLPAADVRLGGPEEFPPHSADILAANLDDRQLDQTLPAILKLWTGLGPLVLSGMRRDRAPDHVCRVGSEPELRVERADFVALAWRSGHEPRGSMDLGR